MKTMNYLIIVSISILAISCSKISEPVKKIGLGSKVIDYQDDDKDAFFPAGPVPAG